MQSSTASQWVPPEVDFSLFSLTKLSLTVSDLEPWKAQPHDPRGTLVRVEGEVADIETGRPIPLMSQFMFDKKEVLAYGSDEPFKAQLRQHLIEMATHEIDEALLFNGRRFRNPHPEDPSYIERSVNVNRYRRFPTLEEKLMYDRQQSRAEREYPAVREPVYDCLTRKLLGYR